MRVKTELLPEKDKNARAAKEAITQRAQTATVKRTGLSRELGKTAAAFTSGETSQTRATPTATISLLTRLWTRMAVGPGKAVPMNWANTPCNSTR